ncbi:MAG: C39 family peptidase [Nanoarchaeota archaeon]
MIGHGKKGMEMLPLLMLLGIMVGFAMFFIHHVSEATEYSRNPFFGSLGEREMHLSTMQSRIDADLFVLDLIADYSFKEVLSESSSSLYIESANCGVFMDAPVVNSYDSSCLDDFDFQEITNDLATKLDSKLYSKIVASQLYFPFRYHLSFIQDEGQFKVTGFSENSLSFSVDASDYSEEGSEQEYRPSPKVDSGHVVMDVSNECTYVGRRTRALHNSGNSDAYKCSGNGNNRVCVGPCPEGISVPMVPYFNQCNIRGCDDGRCNIDYRHICIVGCGFKSLQMAYAYYGYLFDEMRSINTFNVDNLIGELRSGRPNNIRETRDRIESEYVLRNVEFQNGAEENTLIATEITDEDYELILDSLEQGLVRLKLSLDFDEVSRTSCSPAGSDIGYCPVQHFVLAIAGNDEYLVVHDPYTSSRGSYRTGINLVMAKEFVKRAWTGYYTIIEGDDD